MTTNILAPDFAQIPAPLKAIDRWVVWRYGGDEGTNKVPFMSRSPKRKASSTDKTTWSSFADAMSAYQIGEFSGVGFVLNGDGLVGVDLDDCVVDGTPMPKALAVLDQLGCEYVEISPSGTGLRSFGYKKGAKAAKGTLGSVKVELYADKRYLCVTGHAIKHGPFPDLTGWDDVWRSIKGRSNTEETEDMDSISSVSSVSSVSGNEYPQYPREVIPKTAGQRNRCSFELARYLKGKHPGAEVEDMLPHVRLWHQTFLDVIDTKHFTVTWADFQHGWEKVRFVPGDQILEKALEHLTDPPAHLIKPAYDDVMKRLIAICMRLQELQGEGSFFLSCRIAGELLGISFTQASSLLRQLVRDGILRVDEVGRMGRASRYTFIPAFKDTGPDKLS